jgi:hypothetical protein
MTVVELLVNLVYLAAAVLQDFALLVVLLVVMEQVAAVEEYIFQVFLMVVHILEVLGLVV